MTGYFYFDIRARFIFALKLLANKLEGVRWNMIKQIQLQSTPVEKEIEAHVMPCHIAYNGPSKVYEFFKVRPQELKTQTSISSFRGRKLCGRTVSLPEKYTGTTRCLRDLT